jgi:hypothetical protein
VSAFDSVRTVISIGVSGDPAQLPRADRVIREAVLEKLVSAGVPLA